MKKNLVLGFLLAIYLPTIVYADAQNNSDRQRADRQHTNRQHNARTEQRARPRFAPIGRQVRELPKRRDRFVVRDRDYFYSGGVYYRPRSQGYVVVAAPFGARVSVLPAGYISFLIGANHYFYVNQAYYLWEPQRREYVVVEEPEGVQTAQPVNSEFFVYPRQGQSEQQTERERYDCHLWGVKQTGFDPSAPTQDANKATDYRRAMSACLEARGYSVK